MTHTDLPVAVLLLRRRPAVRPADDPLALALARPPELKRAKAAMTAALRDKEDIEIRNTELEIAMGPPGRGRPLRHSPIWSIRAGKPGQSNGSGC